MTEFIEELCRQFLTVYDIEINRSCIVDLDSSTSKKFSRHLIVHLPNGSLFADARSAGFFVKQFIGRLADELSTGVLTTRRPTLAKHLFVNSQASKAEVQSSEMLDEIHNTDMAVHNDYTGSSVATTKVDAKFTDQKKVCFVDLGVYTRNRLFRLMGSSKFGKPVSAALRISDANSFPFPPEFDNSKFYLPDQTPRATNPSALTHSPGTLAVRPVWTT